MVPLFKDDGMFSVHVLRTRLIPQIAGGDQDHKHI